MEDERMKKKDMSDIKIWRHRAHKAFDVLWKERLFDRGMAYIWLAIQMDMDPQRCHFRYMTIEECRKAIKLIDRYKKEMKSSQS